MDHNNLILLYLTKLFDKINIKFNINDETKTKIITEFYGKNKEIFENSIKNNNTNILINYLSDFLMKKIIVCVYRFSFNNNDKELISKYKKESLCLPFLKSIEFIIKKTNISEFVFYNFTYNVQISFISSMIENITETIHYVNEDFELNNKFINKKIKYLFETEDWKLKEKCNNIIMFDCSIRSSREVAQIAKKIDNCNIIISFGKKIYMNNNWITFVIKQYNITLFIHLSKNLTSFKTN
jgi:hypothetical protein